MFHCIERTLDIKTRDYKIRLWISQDSLHQTRDELELERFVVDEVCKFVSSKPSKQNASMHTVEGMIEYISKLSEKIHAIQVKPKSHLFYESGLMVYTVPF